jgi:hypothetical protein
MRRSCSSRPPDPSRILASEKKPGRSARAFVFWCCGTRLHGNPTSSSRTLMLSSPGHFPALPKPGVAPSFRRVRPPFLAPARDAVVAQLVRAPVCGTGGRWFEPTQLYQINQRLKLIISRRIFPEFRVGKAMGRYEKYLWRGRMAEGGKWQIEGWGAARGQIQAAIEFLCNGRTPKARADIAEDLVALVREIARETKIAVRSLRSRRVWSRELGPRNGAAHSRWSVASQRAFWRPAAFRGSSVTPARNCVDVIVAQAQFFG